MMPCGKVALELHVKSTPQSHKREAPAHVRTQQSAVIGLVERALALRGAPQCWKG